jgi:Protein of unknown function (DUF3102)
MNKQIKANKTDPTTAAKADSKESKSRADFVGEIWAAYKPAVECILKMGSILIAAKAALDHGEFLKMIKTDLPFTASTAERLMKIASDERLSNPAHVQLLPAAWGTLYELSKLDNAAFEQAASSGKIHPKMTRSNAVKLLPPPAPALADKVTPANKVQQAAQHFYTLACDATADWTDVDWDMIDDLIEQLRSRRDANKANVAGTKAWVAAAPDAPALTHA